MTSNNRNNNRDNNKYNNYKVLDNLFRNYKVFIDTCSLMYYNPKAVKKLFVLISKLSHKYNNPLIIPYKVIWELQKHKRSNDPETYAKAKNALEILEHYRSEGNKCFEVYADDNDKEFADPVFLKVFQMYHLDFNRALITQDYDLSNDVLNLLKQKSVQRSMKSIKVYKFQHGRFLVPFHPNSDENKYQPGSFVNNQARTFKQNNNFRQIVNAEENDNRKRSANNSSKNLNSKQSYNKRTDHNDVQDANSEKRNTARPDSNNKNQVGSKTQNTETLKNNSPLKNNKVNINKINYGWQNNAFSSLNNSDGLDTGFDIYKDEDKNEDQGADMYQSYDGNNSRNNSNDDTEHSQNNSDLFTELDDEDIPEFNDPLISDDFENASILEENAIAIQGNSNGGTDSNDDTDHSQNNSDLFTELDDEDIPEFNDPLISDDSENASITEDNASAIQANSNDGTDSNDDTEHSQNNVDLFTELDNEGIREFNGPLISADSEKASISEENTSAAQNNGKADTASNDANDDNSKLENTSNTDNDVSENDKEDNDDTEDNAEDDAEDDADFSDTMSSDNTAADDDSADLEAVISAEVSEEESESETPSSGSESTKGLTEQQLKYLELKAQFEACLVNRFTKVTKVPDTPVPVKELPGVKSVVYSGKSQFILKTEISRGGEGIIYSVNKKYVAKIYKSNTLTTRRIKKIQLLLSKNLKYQGICFPCRALYNQYQEFVGYLMPRAKGKELQRSLFIKPLFLQNFPDWQKVDLVKLCITILFKIKYLHQHGIIMGDINPMNILVVSPEEVYFVDTDSYQVDDYPCPVGTINYTAPEIQRKDFRTFLRTFGNEHFSVATLLFMLMLPGKPPYSQQGGGDAISNIINMNFSYPLGGESNRKTPDGPWRFIWSHLLYRVKEAFYETFKKDGKHSTEDTRLTVFEWISIFKSYQHAIESGKMDIDKLSLTLFPDKFKAYITEDGEKVVQKSKTTEFEGRHCQKCGTFFKITEKEIEDCKNNGKDLPTICPRCTHGIYKTIVCCDCGKRFNFTERDRKFFEENEYDQPKRCLSCRAAKRRYNQGGRRDIRDNKGCFLNMLLFGLFLH